MDDIQFIAGKDRDAGRVLPHLQQPLRRPQADGLHRRPLPRTRSPISRTGSLALPVGAHRRHPGARARDPHRHPREEGAEREAAGARRHPRVHGHRRCRRNIRELEGTLIRVTAFASLNRTPVDLALVQTVLKDLITLDEDNVIAPVDIINHTADYFKLSVDDLYGSSPLAGRRHRPADRHVPLPRADQPLAARRSASCSATATTPRSCTPTRRSASS